MAIADAATRHVQDGGDRAGEYTSAGKAYLGVYGVEVLQDCVQMHGGIGVTFDHDMHLYLRRVVVDSLLFGTVSDHRQRLTTLLEKKEDDECLTRASSRSRTSAAGCVHGWRTTCRAPSDRVPEWRWPSPG